MQLIEELSKQLAEATVRFSEQNQPEEGHQVEQTSQVELGGVVEQVSLISNSINKLKINKK